MKPDHPVAPLSLKLTYPSRKFIPELDGVRGIAVWLVLFYHCFPGKITGLGWIGVDLFFVLSGFLITGILIDTKGSPRYYLNFIVRRILRIFPLYYLILTIIFVLLPLILKRIPHDFVFYLNNQVWFWSYLQNWMYAIKGFPENHLLVHLWSLGVEEQFYLVWPFIILFTPNRHLIRVSLALCFIALILRSIPLDWFHLQAPYRYMATLPRMDALLIGAIIAQMIRKNQNLLERLALPFGLIGLIIFIFGVYYTGSESFLHLAAFFTPADLFLGLVLLLSFSQWDGIRRFLRTRFLTLSGKYSYGLYVYHYIIYNFFIYVIHQKAIVVSPNPVIRVIIIGLATVIPSVIISVLSYHLFESRFLRLKSYFQNNHRSGNSR